MVPDYLIYDEIKRREERPWEPVPLELPLYQPYWPEPSREGEEEDEGDGKVERGVVIIDMIDYTEIREDED